MTTQLRRAGASTATGNRWPSIGELWTFLGVALPTLAALIAPLPAVDLAYHLRAGAGILAGGGIPAVDAWTFTAAGTPWLDQQWGAQVLLAGVFQVAGWTGLVALRAALVAATFWLVTSTLTSMACARRPAALLALGSFVVAAPALALRPQLFAIVLFAAAIAILADRARHPRRLWLLPLIAAAWANLHGTFPIILVLLALGWVDEIGRVLVARAAIRPGHGPGRATAALRGSTGIALIGAVSAAATLANPFGIDAWRYVVELASNPTISETVSEWRPPSLLDPADSLFFASVVIAVVVVALRLRADKWRPGAANLAPAATLLAFGALGLLTGRGLAWWALIAPVGTVTLAHGSALTDQLPRRLRPLAALFTEGRRGVDRGSPLNALVVLLVVAVGAALVPLWRPVGPAGVASAALSYAPQGIAVELEQVVATGVLPEGAHVWNPQTWGSWLEFASPRVKVALDSRIELFPVALWSSAARVAAGECDWESVLDANHVDAVVVAADQEALDAAIGKSARWSREYADGDGYIWIRSAVSVGNPGSIC